MAVQHDLLIGGKLEQDVDGSVRFVDVADVILDMVEAIDAVPTNIARVEFLGRHGSLLKLEHW